MAAGDFLSSVELISPAEFAKGKILAVQNYALLCAQAIGNLFRRPLYVADIIQQADFIGWGSISIVVLAGFFHRRGAGTKQRQYAGTVWFGLADWATSFSRHGAAIGSGHHRLDGSGTQRLRHGQRTRFHEGD